MAMSSSITSTAGPIGLSTLLFAAAASRASCRELKTSSSPSSSSLMRAPSLVTFRPTGSNGQWCRCRSENKERGGPFDSSDLHDVQLCWHSKAFPRTNFTRLRKKKPIMAMERGVRAETRREMDSPLVLERSAGFVRRRPASYRLEKQQEGLYSEVNDTSDGSLQNQPAPYPPHYRQWKIFLTMENKWVNDVRQFWLWTTSYYAYVAPKSACVAILQAGLGVALAACLTAGIPSYAHAGTADGVGEGAAIFHQSCAACHVGGGNVVQPGATLFLRDLTRNGIEDEDAIYAISYFGKRKMPGYGVECQPRGQCTFGPRLTDEQLHALAKYVLQEAVDGWPTVSTINGP